MNQATLDIGEFATLLDTFEMYLTSSTGTDVTVMVSHSVFIVGTGMMYFQNVSVDTLAMFHIPEITWLVRQLL